MKKRILFLATALLSLLLPNAGKSQPPLPKPIAHPLSQFKHKQHRAKGTGMPHFFQVKK